MSEIEVLLSVDAGRVPPDTVVFFAADPEASIRRMYTFLAVTGALGSLGVALSSVGAEAVVLLSVITAVMVVLALPTSLEPEEARNKRPTLVVTPRGMIVRDAGGLRTWRFSELAEVLPCHHAHSIGLLLVGTDGSREFLDCLVFRRGERLGEVIGRHMKPRAT
jgi:hypothetical protein